MIQNTKFAFLLASILLLTALLAISAAEAAGRPSVEVNFRNIPDNVEHSFTPQINRLAARMESFPHFPATNNYLECKLYASITLDGRILNTEIEEASGDAAFDRAALVALRNLGSLGAFPNLGPQILLADIMVINRNQGAVKLKQIEIESADRSDVLNISETESRSPEKSDWIDDEHLYASSAFVDRGASKPVVQHQQQSRSPEPSSKSGGDYSALQGFKLLNPFQLRYISESQKSAYLSKLRQWFDLPPAEKFNI